MKKRLISILLAVALTAGLLPAPAFAADSADTGVYIAGVQLEVGKKYTNADFWPAQRVEPTPVPSETPAPSAESTYSLDSTSSYTMTRSAVVGDANYNAYLVLDDTDGYTLYIKDLSVMGYTNANNGAAIYSEQNLTIVLEGVNSAIGADDDYWATGIYANGNLTIKGNGTLTATGGNSSVSISQGICADIVTVTGGATVIATGGTVEGTEGYSTGIYSYWGVVIEDGSTVIATGGSADCSYGIEADDVNITDATVVATGGTALFDSTGIYVYVDATITSSTVIARAGTVGGEFNSNDRRAISPGTVNLNSAELVGGVCWVGDTLTQTDDPATATSLAIVPTSWTDEFPEADADNTYNINNDTYIISTDAVALEIDTDTDATINADGHTLLAVSLFEGSGNTAGIRSTASVRLNGNIIAVSGLSIVDRDQGAVPCSGFEVPIEAEGKTVTVNGSLLAVGAGTPRGYGTGYSSAADTAVNGTLIGVGVSGAHTHGIYMPSTENGTDLTVNDGGTVLGYAGPATPTDDEIIIPEANGIHVTGTLSASGSVTGVGAIHGLSGTQSVNGGAYLGKGRAVSPQVEPTYGYDFLNADGEVPADPAAEQYLTVGVKKYTVTIYMDDPSEGDEVMALPDIPHGQSVSSIYAETIEGFKTEMENRKGDNYTFRGWYTSEDDGETLSDEPYDFDSSVTADVTLYPKWTRNPIIRPTEEPTEEPTDEPTTEPTDEPVDDGRCPQDDTCPISNYDDSDPKAWYHDGVHFCIERGLMIGTSETEFEPHSPTNRAMIVTILHRLAGEPETTTTGAFTDVSAGMWYSEAVEWAAANGIVLGHGDGTYAPLDPLTREQAATILYRYVQYLGGGFTGMWAFRLDFSDLADMSDWAYEGVAWCVMNGIIEGYDGKLDPKGSIERCETATMVYRLCQLLEAQE